MGLSAIWGTYGAPDRDLKMCLWGGFGCFYSAWGQQLTRFWVHRIQKKHSSSALGPSPELNGNVPKVHRIAELPAAYLN
jgi:hypothetical protein